MRVNASLSLDLDNAWSYLKTHGDAGWESAPSYLPRVLPRVLEMLRELDLTITFFVVGRDAADPANAAVLRAIAAAGHEIGNHSQSHEPWFHRYDRARTSAEIVGAEEAIVAATGVRPRGFRGPGYSLSEAALETLAARAYDYDASTLPTFVGPLARAYYFMTSGLDRTARRERSALFGSLSDALQPLKPYRWETAAGPLLEIPVTTMPLVRTPMHVSYQLYLAQYSEPLMSAYFRSALGMCALTRTEPSLLLHPLDFMGSDDAAGLDFFPGMQIATERKLHLVRGLLTLFRERFDVVALGEHARRIGAGPALRSRKPKLRPQAA
jgi:peptidoglycan/xylan/chitin deacetylase (PgdA/CDA1 family)